MATVKGDVHDIGKNIVGVVLQCNGYEVIDLGVMVPAEKILDTARREKIDIIGLSGLITPSLDEMVNVASEMERLGFEIPLMIGGATTSRIHTAVKIEPQYHGPIVHVNDASRAVGVASNLLSDTLRDDYVASIKSEYKVLRDRRAAQQEDRSLASLDAARANAFRGDWNTYTPPAPIFTGTRVFDDYPLDELVRRIDWTPFFRSWELAGRFPNILEDEVVGTEATRLYRDARAMLEKIVKEKWLTCRAVIGFYRASSEGDDIRLYQDGSNDTLMMLHHLRQQTDVSRKQGKPNLCLSDYIAPTDSGVEDYLGAFAVTAGIGIEAHLARFEADHDDYSSIMLKALADRLAEAFAERMHERVRREFWAYDPDENFNNDDLIRERYRGIRPAPGYPACPDHTEKTLLWDLLAPSERIGITLTESYAMYPASSVSGWYFSHPEARYFGTGKIGRDQVEDYAQRTGHSVREIERTIPHLLGYNS